MRRHAVPILLFVAIVTVAMSTAAQRTLEQMLNSSGQIVKLPFWESTYPDLAPSGQCAIYDDDGAHQLRISCNGQGYRAILLGPTPTATPTPTSTATPTFTP